MLLGSCGNLMNGGLVKDAHVGFRTIKETTYEGKCLHGAGVHKVNGSQSFVVHSYCMICSCQASTFSQQLA